MLTHLATRVSNVIAVLTHLPTRVSNVIAVLTHLATRVSNVIAWFLSLSVAPSIRLCTLFIKCTPEITGKIGTKVGLGCLLSN